MSASEPGVTPDWAGMTVFRDTTFLAVGPQVNPVDNEAEGTSTHNQIILPTSDTAREISKN